MARATSVCMERCGTGQRRVRNVMCAWRRLRTRGCSDYANRRECEAHVFVNVLQLRYTRYSDVYSGCGRNRRRFDIHVSTAACPNIRVWTFLEMNRIPSISKLQTYHICVNTFTNTCIYIVLRFAWMLAAGIVVRDLQGVLGEMKLEQSEQERGACSKRESCR